MSENKVKYNLKNCHYSVITFNANDEPTYATPVRLPGAVSLSLDANGEPENFYADGIAYYVINNNQGYDGELELAIIPEGFRKDVLHEINDTNNVLVESSDAQIAHFALLFEFDGDQKQLRHVLYNCSAGRPSIEGQTNEDTKTVKTEKIKLKATPLTSGAVKAKTASNTDNSVYNNWYGSVYIPAADCTLSALSFTGLTLTPTFAAGTTTYTAENDGTVASSTITATATAQTASVVCKVDGVIIAAGASITWTAGTSQVVTVTVTNGGTSKTYTVTVTTAA